MLRVCIEVSKGSQEKHKYDEKSLEFRKTVDVIRPYPYAYGFILGTLTEDGEAVDCFIVSDTPFLPGTVVECELQGLLEMWEDDEEDHKAIAGIPGEKPVIDEGVRVVLQQFITTIFTRFPEIEVRIGNLLDKHTAEEYIRQHQS